ncbi:MAG: rod shape-determining protein MreC [Myxococcales bacterium]|nr:rod shape-determining protein MreC [Myxococcales bacterium]
MLDLIGRYKVIIIMVLMVALPTLSMALSRIVPGRHVVDRAMLMALAPLQAGAHFGVSFIEGFWQDYIALRDLKQENESLRQEISRLREERARLIGVLQENKRLRGLLDFQQQRPELKLQPARVIAREITPYFRVLRVRLDTGDASTPIKPQMAVVSHEGVVGQVIEAYDEYADVMLIADPRSNVDVIDQRTRARGIAIGLGHKRDYEARLSYLLRKDEINEQDQLVTSGKGGIFPQELIVGTITSIDSREYGLNQQATVEPSVDFGRLEEVFIVTGEETAGVRP